jgi:hypothetical protein
MKRVFPTLPPESASGVRLTHDGHDPAPRDEQKSEMMHNMATFDCDARYCAQYAPGFSAEELGSGEHHCAQRRIMLI